MNYLYFKGQDSEIRRLDNIISCNILFSKHDGNKYLEKVCTAIDKISIYI